MKINTLYPGIDGLDGKKKPDSASGAPAVNFSDILDNATGKKVSSTGASAPISGPDAAMNMQSLSPEQNAALSSGETALDLLGHLGSILENGDNAALGSIDSIADYLGEQVNTLMQTRDSLDASDPLRKTLNEIGILAAVQGNRINRGDYE